MDAFVALHLAYPFAPAKGHQILKNFKSWEEMVNSDDRLKKVLDEDLVNQARKEASTMGVEMIEYGSSGYPASLKALADPPLVLYCKGDSSTLTSPSIAIVGTRQCSIYGATTARKFGSDFGKHEVTVVSGLARGVDTSAHEGALDQGKTVAVIGSGLGHIYPKENIPLAKKISEQGAICSEYPLSTAPDRFQFPRRNRIIAALSSGAILIEAPEKSGAMGTMDWAEHLQKPCFALPGRVDWESFCGNHRLLKCGKAKLVENAGEVVSLLWPGAIRKPEKMVPAADLTPAEQQLLLQFPQDEISFDELALSTQVTIPSLNALLISLSIKKIIREFPGKLYKKVV